MFKTLLSATALTFISAIGTAAADDWTASQLRGQVVQLVDGSWQVVHRGDAVPDTHFIHTLANGYATFTRGVETVQLGPDTQIEIIDRPGSGKPYTIVKEAFGTVSIEAEVEQVEHFSVQTPYLAAVVKGTRFTVMSGTSGSSVSVQRGHVAVEDFHTHTHVTLAVRQVALVDQVQTAGAIAVSGEGKLPPVLDAKGKPVPPPKKPAPPGLAKKGPPGPPGQSKDPKNPPAPPPKDPKPPKPPKPPKGS